MVMILIRPIEEAAVTVFQTSPGVITGESQP